MATYIYAHIGKLVKLDQPNLIQKKIHDQKAIIYAFLNKKKQTILSTKVKINLILQIIL
jgi:hypothetical protein